MEQSEPAPSPPAGADDQYDPHDHRTVHKTITYGEAMTHMLKGTIGAGMLAMPSAFSRMGLVFGIIFAIFLLVLATSCLQILILSQYELCKQLKVGYMSFTDSMKVAVQRGPPRLRWSATMFSISVEVLLIVWQIGVCAVYLVFVAENVNQFLAYIGSAGYSLRILICWLYPPLVVMGMVRDLKMLAPLSTMSNCCNFFGIILVFFYLIEDDVELKPSDFMIKSIMDIPIFIGTVLFAMEAVGVLLALEYRMAKPKEFTGWFGVLTLGMTFITIIYMGLGSFGFIKYKENTKAAITLNLPREEKKAQAAIMAFTISIFTSFPLQNYVAWQIIMALVAKRWKETKRKVDYMVRVFCTSLPFVLALAAPTLGPFIGLLGSLCLPTLAMLYPAILDICVYYPARYGCLRWKLWTDLIIIVLSIFCCFCGCLTSVMEMQQLLSEQ